MTPKVEVGITGYMWGRSLFGSRIALSKAYCFFLDLAVESCN